MNHDEIKNIDLLIHAPLRLAILSILISVDSADFSYLKTAIETSDGNLSTHLNKLENAEYITIEKVFINKKPKSICRLTKSGRAAFTNYLNKLQFIIDDL